MVRPAMPIAPSLCFTNDIIKQSRIFQSPYLSTMSRRSLRSGTSWLNGCWRRSDHTEDPFRVAGLGCSLRPDHFICGRNWWASVGWQARTETTCNTVTLAAGGSLGRYTVLLLLNSSWQLSQLDRIAILDSYAHAYKHSKNSVPITTPLPLRVRLLRS
ncbi:uncharacterized protein EI97DRAFT_105423 [Westerdykella ornata]|uniref:Uncharacterized protein n=1 Tax=Westerdykella ornata TaxID=318751 RepID=A0A6A6JTG4_WESOR|nr:uncharacterized protein EI97DRAFT_105423 [Westerdykella ornata]KAF2279910.1 hypothetical protein EI97DRAFT_105423 [Westerdykella ornata]